MTAPRDKPTSPGLRRRMVEALQQAGAIRSPAVRRVFLAEPRERYVSEVAARDGLEAVYRMEAALVTATDRRGMPVSSSSAPSIMAPMLEALEIRPGMRVLEVGAGTGYNAALLTRLVGGSGRLVSVDIDPKIARRAKAALLQAGHRVRVVVGDGRQGWPSAAPFDRIIVTASSDTVPRAWRDQLADGGLLVVPFRFSHDFLPQAVLALRRQGPLLRSTRVIPGGFMALRAAGDAEAPIPAQPSLNAGGTAGGAPTPFAWINGSRIAHLAERHRPGLLATVLAPPRARRAIPAADAPALVMFLSLHPGGQTVQCGFKRTFGAGVIGPRGTSFAAVTYAPGKSGRIEAWGEPAAEQRLARLIDEWRRLGKPHLQSLVVTVSYNTGGDGRPGQRAWQKLNTAEAELSLTWRSRSKGSATSR